ncbi:MAG: hypothetical protein APF84_16055 [Gracilibacter sp. BRH_c7a]|nr:MAG: hypothetical protein APF84_16055 [Gracilibacter sp. BRH_c7a]
MKWTWKTGKKLLYLTIPEWLEQGVTVGFSTRGGGESKEPYLALNLALHVNDNEEDVLRNRNIFLAEFDMESENCVTAQQVHGTEINIVLNKDKGRGMKDIATAFSQCDGLLTQESIGMLSFYADCVPLYFFNPEIGIVGIAHAGWKGTANKIASKAIQEIKLAGGLVEDTLVGIGPCIKECCYEVDVNVASFFKSFHNPHILQQHQDKYKLNLAEANKEVLISEGVPNENIVISDLCTACNPNLFFSYRRDGLTGRMGAFIRKRKEF